MAWFARIREGVTGRGSDAPSPDVGAPPASAFPTGPVDPGAMAPRKAPRSEPVVLVPASAPPAGAAAATNPFAAPPTAPSVASNPFAAPAASADPPIEPASVPKVEDASTRCVYGGSEGREGIEVSEAWTWFEVGIWRFDGGSD
jgi:hypothetical protein